MIDTVATVGSWQVQPNAVNSGTLGWLFYLGLQLRHLQVACHHVLNYNIFLLSTVFNSAPGSSAGNRCARHWSPYVCNESVFFCPPLCSTVPRETALEIDVRDIDGPRRDGVLAAIKAKAAAIAERRKVGWVGLMVWVWRRLECLVDSNRFPCPQVACFYPQLPLPSVTPVASCLCSQVRLQIETINQDPPAACGTEVVAAVEGAVRWAGSSVVTSLA